MSISGLLVATFIGWGIEILWYLPSFFGKSWIKESHLSTTGFKKEKAVYLYIFLNTLLSAIVLSQLIRSFTTEPSIFQGLFIGAVTSLGLVTPLFATTFLIENKSMKYLLLTITPHVLATIIMGAVLTYSF